MNKKVNQEEYIKQMLERLSTTMNKQMLERLSTTINKWKVSYTFRKEDEPRVCNIITDAKELRYWFIKYCSTRKCFCRNDDDTCPLFDTLHGYSWCGFRFALMPYSKIKKELVKLVLK